MNHQAPLPTAGRIRGGVAEPLAHDSALRHVTGSALYVDDLPEPPGTLHGAFGLSDRPHARILSMDLDAVRAAPGVVAVLTAADVPGVNDVGPVFGGDPIFADGIVEFAGQALFGVVATSMELARRAARLGRVVYEDLPALLTVEAGLAAEARVLPPMRVARGDAAAAIAAAPHRLEGTLVIGGQDHFYLEGQVSLALPQEGGDVFVHCSTQHPSEVQHLIAKVLDKPHSAVTVEVRRMGGGFGGKETQAAQFAAAAALFALHTGRPVKVRLDRDDDMVMTGKRHDFRIDWQVGFDGEGRVAGASFVQAARCGYSADLSGAIADRAMMHADNAYYLPAASVVSHRTKTHTVSNTAFRGFGGPQGMMGIEQVMDEIARALGRDPLDVRKVNLYGGPGRDMTPYGMAVEDNILPELLAELEASSGYAARRQAIAAFNAASPVVKRGIALTPVKFGISFTTTHLNQAGALIHVYTDGSVHLNHGGTEMGQGLMVKVAQIVAEELQVDIDHIKVMATSTAKVPNTSATAASSGADLNGAAAQIAARTIRERMAAYAAEHFGVAPETVRFCAGRVELGGGRAVAFGELARLCHMGRISLSATGYYRTPKIHFDYQAFQGRPYLYFAYGAAVAEVAIDTLTGEHRLLRADVIHDVGRSLNPAIDLGQVEGGFVQGMGWLTTEELVWRPDGRLATHAPSTYKIPACGDVPAEFHVRLWERGENIEPVVHRSKAVGEPPLMLGIAVFHAIRDAVAAVGGGASPRLDAPATPERVLMAVEELRSRTAAPAARAAE